MAIRAWVPSAEPFAQLQREMNRLFDSVFGKHFASGRLRSAYVYPATNVRETADAYIVTCEVPGLAMDDLEVYVARDQLTLSGVREDGIPQEGATLHRRERDSGRFSRAINLPGPVQGDATEAALTHGVLTVRIPKAEEAKPKRVQVEVQQ